MHKSSIQTKLYQSKGPEEDERACSFVRGAPVSVPPEPNGAGFCEGFFAS